ncbi:HD-GYP domain-containing protein [Paenibacillus sp. QZ-Y1]|uniref:HD-GYP domain-containing protein n=1 Tax=Paenibacillus sp. QZ-Y1 TaxID=3414511 RepID=UPI003F7A495B
MEVYRSFIFRLVRNYLIGSLTAVFVVGTVVMASTLQISNVQYVRLIIIVLVSLLFMLVAEGITLRTQLGPLRHFFASEHHEKDELTRMYEHIHRLPGQTIYRILGPHMLGFSLPAVGLTLWMISTGWLEFPYGYVGVAAACAILIAMMHALVEYFLTVSAIRPLLLEVRRRGKVQYSMEPSLGGRILVSIQRKFQLSTALIGLFPLFLFFLATFIRFQYMDSEFAKEYIRWGILIVVLGAGFAMVGSCLLIRDVRGPVVELTEEMNRIQEGALCRRTPDLYADEFSALISGFNMMNNRLEMRQERNRQLLQSYFSMLAAALDARDKYTAGHSMRVAEYSLMIGKLSGMTEEQADLLYKSALLHDIGKIGIPDEVLLKDGKLSDEEFAVIRTHPVLGESILLQIEPIDAMADFLPGVRSHHERYDGKGYPDGMAGEEIPLFGRIIAVADAFDAMTSDRTYRTGMSHEKALAILEEGKGTQWDPYFAGLFIDEWRRQQNLWKPSERGVS